MLYVWKRLGKEKQPSSSSSFFEKGEGDISIPILSLTSSDCIKAVERQQMGLKASRAFLSGMEEICRN